MTKRCFAWLRGVCIPSLCLVLLAACDGSEPADTTGSGGTGGSGGAPAGGAGGGETGGGGGEPAKTPLEIVESMVGTYEGSWEMIGLGATDQPETAMKWTDVAVAADPQLEAERAYVSVVDTMEIEGGGQQTFEWIEGVLILADGSAGDRFIETDGVVTVQPLIEKDHYQYQSEIANTDFYFWMNVTQNNLITGHHVTDKLVTWEGGETHNITRTTHLEWDPGTGPKTVDFTSLTGTHHKVP